MVVFSLHYYYIHLWHLSYTHRFLWFHRINRIRIWLKWWNWIYNMVVKRLKSNSRLSSDKWKMEKKTLNASLSPNLNLFFLYSGSPFHGHRHATRCQRKCVKQLIFAPFDLKMIFAKLLVVAGSVCLPRLKEHSMNERDREIEREREQAHPTVTVDTLQQQFELFFLLYLNY